MTLEVSHLVVNGCSLTYCQGLDKPNEQGWPALLAKKIDVPVVNLAVGGSGNDAICRRTVEYVYKNLGKNSKPFFIIAFSEATRKEVLLKKYNSKAIKHTTLIDFTTSAVDYLSTLSDLPENRDEFNQSSNLDYITDLSFVACERKKLLMWISIINTFKAHDIPYFTTDYLPTLDESTLDIVRREFKDISNYVYQDENKLKDFYMLTKHLKKLPCNHDAYEAQELLADYVYNSFIKKYSSIKVVKTDYLKLNEFYSNSYQKMIQLLGNPWL